MKPKTSRSLFNLHWAATAVLFTFVGAAQAFATALIDARPAWLGANQILPNSTTITNLTDMSDKAKQELWVMRVLKGADQVNVFSDNMIGAPGSGKPFITYDDISRVAGSKIHVPTIAGLGGPGVQGEGARSGYEEKIRASTFPVQVGRQWYGVAITDVAKEESVIGSSYDNLVNKLLRDRLGKKKSEDMLMVLKSSALSSNTIFPNFKSTREGLRSADVISTTTIAKSGMVVSSLGGQPVKTVMNKAGGPVEQFLFFGHQHGLSAIRTEENYLLAQRQAAARGDGNSIFKGDFSDWDGHGIYRWMIRDHDAYGPVGSAILPRAFLGAAVTAANTTFDLKGGGSTAAAAVTPAPLYFEGFSNYTYTFTNGLTVTPDSTTVRYLAIQNLTGADAGKIGFYSYQVNDGNKITILGRLRASASGIAVTTLGNVTWDTSGANPWNANGSGSYTTPDGTFAGLTDAHPLGSLVVETNSYGVPICGSFMLGEMAGICGHGRLTDRNAKAARTEVKDDHGMHHGVGIETCFGSAAAKRTDDKVPNYCYVESTYQLDGFPYIAG